MKSGELTSDFANPRCRSWAASAEHVGRGQTGDGAVVLDSSHTCACFVFTADPEFLPGRVSGDGRRRSEENGGVLHPWMVDGVRWQKEQRGYDDSYRVFSSIAGTTPSIYSPLSILPTTHAP